MAPNLTRGEDFRASQATNYTYNNAGDRLTEKQTYQPGNPAADHLQNNAPTCARQSRLASVQDDRY